MDDSTKSMPGSGYEFWNSLALMKESILLFNKLLLKQDTDQRKRVDWNENFEQTRDAGKMKEESVF